MSAYQSCGDLRPGCLSSVEARLEQNGEVAELVGDLVEQDGGRGGDAQAGRGEEGGADLHKRSPSKDASSGGRCPQKQLSSIQ